MYSEHLGVFLSPHFYSDYIRILAELHHVSKLKLHQTFNLCLN